jgi:xylulokinase
VILTVDFGTSVTKVALWGDGGLVALSRSELVTTYPNVGWTEQDPLRWWTTVVIACAEARAVAPTAFQEVDVVACSGARQTFVPVTAEGNPIGKGILWSDRRGAAQSRALAERMGGDDINRARTGIPLDAASVAGKLAWLAENEPERLEAAHTLLSPRDFIVHRMTDQWVTDVTFASRSGLYDFDGNAVRELAGPALGKLPSVVPSDTIVGQLKAVPGAELGLKPGIPVVIGAGDRQCEVLGSGASEDRPMVSWGTTANVSVPVHERPVPSPAGAVVTRAAGGGWLLEGGLSAAGSFLAWLGRLLDRTTNELATLASNSPPGARGVVAVPWLDGARAPWWRDDARAGFMGLGAAHGADDLARAVMESVAWDVLRVMEVVTVGRLGGSTAEGVTLGGSGTGLPLWVEVLTSVLGVPATRHRSGEAASAGAALLAGRALGMNLTLEEIDPVAGVIQPDPESVELYRRMRGRVDHVALSVLAATESLPEPGRIDRSPAY